MVAPWSQNQPIQNRHPDNVRDTPQTRHRSAGGGPTYWADGGLPPTQEELEQNMELTKTLENIIRSQQRNDNDINEVIRNFNQPLSSNHM